MVRTFVVLGLILLAFIVIYSVIPNVVTRVFRLGVMRRGPAEPTVALTFDDGPDAAYTPRLLDELRAHRIPATFFVIADKAVRHPEIIGRMLAEGHEVQIHGYSHALVPALPPGLTVRQVKGASECLVSQYGIHPRLYRPTWGLCNLVTLLHPEIRKFTLITWSVMVGDWRNVPPGELLRRILRRLHPGAVIVLHDSDQTWGAVPGAPEQVIRLIPDLATAVRGKGYEFVRLSDWLMPAENHRRNGGMPS